MKTVSKIGRFSIALNRDTYYLRWYDRNKRRQVAQRIGKELFEAETEAYRRMGNLTTPEDIVDRPKNPTFDEFWLFYVREKKPHLSEGRGRRLDTLYRIYFEPKLAGVRRSELPAAIRLMRDEMLNGWLGENRNNFRSERKEALSPNTVEDIVRIACAAVNCVIDEGIFEGVDKIPVVKVPGVTKPVDRAPKGRHLEMKEIAKLIDACRTPHHLLMMLVTASCGCRSGVFSDMMIDQVYWDTDTLDTLPIGKQQTSKYRPVVPVTAPVKWAIAEAVKTAGRDAKLVHFRRQGLTPKNSTQMIHRIAMRGLGETSAKNVNWYSLRHTLFDWLQMRVPMASISALAGHRHVLDSQERRQIRDHDGSATTRIYLRQKLEHLNPIRVALEDEWWPEIQKHCELDLRLGDPNVEEEWREAQEILKRR